MVSADNAVQLEQRIVNLAGAGGRLPLEDVETGADAPGLDGAGQRSLVHNLKQLPNGKWTWKYDSALRGSNRRMGQNPDMTNRLWGYLENLTCPTLVVKGDQSDIIAADTAAQMQQRIPNGQLATVPKAGHLVMGDNPAGFEAAVSEFLNRFA